MTSIEERFSAALHNSARAWRHALDRRLKYLGLSQAGWMTIAHIAKSAEPLSQTGLAHKLGVEDATLVSMLDRLVKAGFVRRQPSDTDRRVKLILLTDAGQQVYQSVRTEADAFRIELFANVDRDKLRELTELLENLHLMAEAAA